MTHPTHPLHEARGNDDHPDDQDVLVLLKIAIPDDEVANVTVGAVLSPTAVVYRLQSQLDDDDTPPDTPMDEWKKRAYAYTRDADEVALPDCSIWDFDVPYRDEIILGPGFRDRDIVSQDTLDALNEEWQDVNEDDDGIPSIRFVTPGVDDVRDDPAVDAAERFDTFMDFADRVAPRPKQDDSTGVVAGSVTVSGEISPPGNPVSFGKSKTIDHVITIDHDMADSSGTMPEKHYQQVSDGLIESIEEAAESLFDFLADDVEIPDGQPITVELSPELREYIDREMLDRLETEWNEDEEHATTLTARSDPKADIEGAVARVSRALNAYDNALPGPDML